MAQAKEALRALGEILGLRVDAASGAIAAAPFIELLISLRKELREAKQYTLADRIRNGLGGWASR